MTEAAAPRAAVGWGSTVGTSKCRTTDISVFRNFEFVYYRIYFLFLYLFRLFEHLNCMIIYKIDNSTNFDSFRKCRILKNFYSSKMNNFRNFMIFEIVKFGKFLEFSKLKNFGTFQIGNV